MARSTGPGGDEIEKEKENAKDKLHLGASGKRTESEIEREERGTSSVAGKGRREECGDEFESTP